jgi:crotonobetainyl-CoA:carnitine CoA-transferase CaiB-like acyl-CoA transferase
VDVCLNAYGWSGPWRNRRGFDSLVQMSSGIADTGMRVFGKDRPTPLPVQALDHATGYLMAAAVIRGLTQRITTGCGFEAKASLASTAALLIDCPAAKLDADFKPAADDDWSAELELTSFGAARRLRAPIQVGGASMRWERPAGALGSSVADW